MRLWSVHPRYLDRQGLIACWRETLLAQAVLGKTSGGYANHPQLHRFRAHAAPAAALGAYLQTLVDEADARGYRFDRSKILVPPTDAGISSLPVTAGQLAYEWDHLRAKLAARSPDLHAAHAPIAHPDPNPVLTEVPGGIEAWERGVDETAAPR